MLSRPAPDAGEAGVGERVRQAVGADVATSAHRLRCPGRLTLAGGPKVRIYLPAQGVSDPQRGLDGESHATCRQFFRASTIRMAWSDTPYSVARRCLNP